MTRRVPQILIPLSLICLCGARSPHEDKGTISEKTYRDAARHCHSKDVIRMKRGRLNVMVVPGIASPDPRITPPSVEAERRIECVRRYLGIPEKDVLIESV
jgi:hypothetical protein